MRLFREILNLAWRAAFNKQLLDEAFNTATNPKYYGYQHRLTSLVYKLIDKKTAGTSIHKETGINSRNQQLAEELQ